MTTCNDWVLTSEELHTREDMRDLFGLVGFVPDGVLFVFSNLADDGICLLEDVPRTESSDVFRLSVLAPLAVLGYELLALLHMHFDVILAFHDCKWW